MEEPSRAELEAAHCWEADDRVPGSPEMTAFRRVIRLHHARWREAHGHPIGSQPIAPRSGAAARPVGSRLALDHARRTGASFLTRGALAAARARDALVEPHQTVDRQRLWADLLWSPALACNLFGDLAEDLTLADRAVHTWWPDVPGAVVGIRFQHSPGRLDPAYLNGLREFDAAFVLDLGDGTRGIVSVGMRYREWSKPETPRPENRARYAEVARRSKAFRGGSVDALLERSGLCLLWLEHLLMLSMLQHPSGEWRWGRSVVVHPAANTDAAASIDRYRAMLADDATFTSVTMEELLDSGALPKRSAVAIRERYLPE